MTYIPSLVHFGVCSGSEKCDHFGQRKQTNKKIFTIITGTLQVPCSGPNDNNYDYNRDLTGSLLGP